MKITKKLITVALLLFVTTATSYLNAQNDIEWSKYQTQWNNNSSKWKDFDAPITLFMANDMGRNGYYEQCTVAELMGKVASVVGPECVIAAGDIHHFEGVRSTTDPLWMTNFETIYKHPELMIPFYPVLGNHEYRGNTKAVIDYTNVSRRWEMPERYYTKVFRKDSTSVRLVFIDTTPIIDKYRNDTATYPDACKQELQKQLSWIDRTLKEAKEDWVIVVGHHPIYAETPKSSSERKDMQSRLNTILKKHRVDIYACGHIHNFQHIRSKDSKIDYVVNSSASLSRKVLPINGTVFCSPLEGFSVLSITRTVLKMGMISKYGEILHTIERKK